MPLRRGTADDLDALDVVFAHAREGMFEYIPRPHTRDEDRRLVELTDGSGNGESEPDARYAWP